MVGCKKNKKNKTKIGHVKCFYVMNPKAPEIYI